MLDMSWGEVLVIGAVALIVIGPKDLPKALRTVGQMTAKVRRMAGEFQSQFSEAMREAELDDVRRQVEGINQSVASANVDFNPVRTIRDELKGSIEAPLTPSTSEVPTAPADPVVSMPALPPLPPVAEPAHTVTAAVEPAPATVETGEEGPRSRPAEAEPVGSKA